MRSRQIIEESFKTIVVQSGNDHIKLEIELMLDIRDLLMQINSRQMVEEISKAREEIEKKRELVMNKSNAI